MRFLSVDHKSGSIGILKTDFGFRGRWSRSASLLSAVFFSLCSWIRMVVVVVVVEAVASSVIGMIPDRVRGR